MINKEKNLNKLLEVLRNSKPEIKDPGELTARIMSQIKERESSLNLFETGTAYLFGWVYIGWVRRSLAAAVLVLIAFFAYEQTVILKRINQLSYQKAQNSMYLNTSFHDPFPDPENTDSVNPIIKRSGRSHPEEDIDEMVRKVSKLREEYRDLFYLIENDPRIRQLVEEKLNEMNQGKKQ